MLDQLPDADASAPAPQLDPAELVAGFERRARRVETPCGEGVMVWRAWGEGPPIALFHGSGGAWSHWIRNIDALAARRTVWAADLPGFGESDMPPAQTHAAIADVLAEGMRRLEPGKAFDVAGFSYGGMMGAHLTARHPDLVRRLVIIGSGGLDTPHGHVEVTTVRGLEGEVRKAVQTANLLSLMLHRRESVDELALYLQWINPRRGRVDPVPLVLPDKMLSALPLIKAHMCAIWGEFDGPHPDPEVQEAVLRRYHPDLAFRVVKDAGHWAMYEGGSVFDSYLIELLDAPLPKR